MKDKVKTDGRKRESTKKANRERKREREREKWKGNTENEGIDEEVGERHR